ncbi:hypothetical protein BV202_00203B, partial [Haemophilus influenzae]
INP